MKSETFDVYKITDLTNNKIYVGGTTSGLSTRFRLHVNKAETNPSTPLQKAIAEKGKDKFKIELLEMCDNLEQLNEREIYWIATLSATNPEIGYNDNIGGGIVRMSEETKAKIGDLHRGKMSEKRKAVLQYNLKGEFVKEYPSLTEAATDNNITRDTILRVINKEATYPTMSNPYIWDYKDNFTTVPIALNILDYYKDPNYKVVMNESCVEARIRSNKEVKDGNFAKLARGVDQYTVDNKFIKSYRSISEASKETGISATSIRTYINDPEYFNRLKNKAKAKFIWKVSSNAEQISKEEVLLKAATKNSKKINKYNCSGNLVKTYSGIVVASKEEHIDTKTIRKAILSNSPYRGYYWGYAEKITN